MDTFKYQLLSSLPEEEQDPWLSCDDSLPMPNFLINDPHADAYPTWILEYDLMDSDQESALPYKDSSTDSPSCSRPKSSWSAPEASVTTEKLIEQQARLISEAFESWRTKFPIKSDSTFATSVVPRSEHCKNNHSKPSHVASDNLATRDLHNPITFESWSIHRGASMADSDISRQ